MPEAFVKDAPRSREEWRRLWSFSLDAYRTVRRPSRAVRVGDVGIGGDNPLRIQSMTIADTLDTAAVVEEIATLARAGCEIVRVTAPNRSAAENLGAIRSALRRQGITVPLVADVHFTPQAALIAAKHVAKVRINPGNYADRKHFKKWEYSDAEYAEELERLEAAFRPLVLCCKERGVALRIGTNHGSLSDRILNRYGDTPLGMVESALEFAAICAHHGLHDLVLSMKASDVKVMIAAYRLLAQRLRAGGLDYPLHLGVTEAGAGLAARVKSAIGIATLLADGIGDTLRVSLTEDSVHELPVARALADTFAAPFSRASETADATEKRGGDGTETATVPFWDPYFFSRRQVRDVGRGVTCLASGQPPRLELLLDAAASGLDSSTLAGWRDESGPDLLVLALPETAPAARAALAKLQPHLQSPVGIALGVELGAAAASDAGLREELLAGPWQRLSLRLAAAELAHLPPELRDWLATLPPSWGLQYTLATDVATAGILAARLGTALADSILPFGAVALLPPPAPERALHAWRAFLAHWPVAAPPPPAVLRGSQPAAQGPRVDAYATHYDLRTAWELGALLADGVGDALQLPAPRLEAAILLGRGILQSTRARLSQADFIACPSCGRTQFDLQSTTARIEARLRHLKGLKIAVMGCIVNGPGEMADADFGYVGSGPGRIDLYVGHERVERSVPEAEAVTRLVELIQRHGRWLDPPGN